MATGSIRNSREQEVETLTTKKMTADSERGGKKKKKKKVENHGREGPFGVMKDFSAHINIIMTVGANNGC